MTSFALPELPSTYKNFIPYITEHPNDPVTDLVAPYNNYEAKLREGFAQHRDHALLQDQYVNAVEIFAGHETHLKIRARSLDDEVENQKYIFPLAKKERKADGSPAIVQSLKEFKQNFNLFSESSLVDLDWTNVVAAGSSVVTALLPVPTKHQKSKRALREYYHKKLAPSSDVDLFIYGLDEAAAIEKIKQIETRIRDSILSETTTIRTKNAITIASQYPTRHVQIVLRLYKSVSEILTGFDVDCSCFAYSGDQVYAAPRALAAFMTQINPVDLSRRSPSYESRLSKYSHRGFEVYWPHLERERVDPTIFERSFARTMGLARLLVLETLPKPTDREEYVVQRRSERGRPVLNNWWRNQHQLAGNMKDQDPDDIAEWVFEDDIANYHTFTIPYGPQYNAKKIERLLYIKDLLLNAEWNTKKDRTVSLHRHPCFIGNAETVIHDCCGACPAARTDEERDMAEQENKIYVTGDLEFILDDPGRQTIGSFHPLTNDDWTDMAYIGNTAELCHAICEKDINSVHEWCSREDCSLDRRDHTGRTPLQLAVQCSSVEVVRCLVDNGARIVARLFDGMTALHIAAWRGNTEIVNILLEKSEANEEAEAEREEQAKSARKKVVLEDPDTQKTVALEEELPQSNGSEEEDEMDDVSSEDSTVMTEGSFVKVKSNEPQNGLIPDDMNNEPDVYDVNVLAWDSPVSPLHLAIMGGHIPVIETLISKFGADILLPIKLVHEYSRQPRAAILMLVLAAQLPNQDAVAVSKCLLALGASSAQADLNQNTAVNFAVAQHRVEVLKELLANDPLSAKGALSHIAVDGAWYHPSVTITSLAAAISTGDDMLVQTLLELGVNPEISFGDFLASYNAKFQDKKDSYDGIKKSFYRAVVQPVIRAVESDMPKAAQQILDFGGDPNSLDENGNQILYNDSNRSYYTGRSLLDIVDRKIEALGTALKEHSLPKPPELEDDAFYIGEAIPGSYEHWQLTGRLESAKRIVQDWHRECDSQIAKHKTQNGMKEKLEKLKALKKDFETLRDSILSHGGQKFEQLHPDLINPEDSNAGHLHTRKPQIQLKVKFGMAPDTEERHDAYLRLFEAAWNGDENMVKQLTMISDGDKAPLQIAVTDNENFSPFSLALCRGHYRLAKFIFNIAAAQYQPKPNGTKLRRRYRINNDENKSDTDDSDNVSISSELVDETFTIDNVVALTKTVGSDVHHSTMLKWKSRFWMFMGWTELEAMTELGAVSQNGFARYISQDAFARYIDGRDPADTWDCLWFYTRGHISLMELAVRKRDIKLAQFLMQTDKATRSPDEEYWTPNVSTEEDFYLALDKGFLDVAGQMILSTGVALPLLELIEQSGKQEEEKPKYYQGLKLFGKHKKEWANQRSGHRNQYRSNNDVAAQDSPILQVAKKGNLTALEWLLSDTAARLYKQYCADVSNDKRLIALSKAYGDCSTAVDTWLSTKLRLVLHRAIQADLSENETRKLITYIVDTIPESLEAKDDGGVTALHMAVLNAKEHAIKALLTVGADPMSRTHDGRNILHQLLNGKSSARVDASQIQKVLLLFDPQALSALSLERASCGPTGVTPFASWLDRGGSTPVVLDLLAQHIPSVLTEVLTMLDGSGQRPLHVAVKNKQHALAAAMLRHSPSLLYMENAMGQTPFELAESLYIHHVATELPATVYRYQLPRPTSERDPSYFVPGRESEEERCMNGVVKTWKVMRDAAALVGGRDDVKRKLVSVMEASEVARRLAEKKKRERIAAEEKSAKEERDG